MSPQASWLLENEIVPRLRVLVPHSVHQIGHEDQEELVQDITLMAARMLMRVEQQNKQVTPGNIVHYAILHARAGRRSYGSSRCDVLHPKARLETVGEPYSFDDVVKEDECGGEPLTLNDVFTGDAEDPSEACARKLDWQDFLAGQDARTVAVVVCLCEGRPMREVAAQFRVSVSSIQLTKNQLKRKVREFMGADVLARVQKVPSWKHGILAHREMQACRSGRN